MTTTAAAASPSIQRYRSARVTAQLASRDLAAVLLCDPVNIRYATGSRNMQVWTMHNLCRYALVFADGHTVLFELNNAHHLAQSLPAVDELRSPLSSDYMVVGPRVDEMSKRWASEIDSLVRARGGGNRAVAIDRLDPPLLLALQKLGVEPHDGKEVMERARAVKSDREVAAFVASLRTCDTAVSLLRERVRPGMSEQEALAMLLGESVRQGGEYPETRLLTSGPRTNPWFQETNARVIEAGDFLSLDTDLIGPDGFYNDISRSWVVDAPPSDQQRRLYEISRAQLEHNIALLRPGIGFLEYAEKAYRLPDEYLANRYADVAHGCGLAVEYPFIHYPQDADSGAYDGEFEVNMIVCVESYVGALGGNQGVKLEQPVLVSADGPRVLSSCPLEDDYA